MFELISRVAEEDPARVAVRTHDGEVTYQALAAAARACADRLRAEEVDRFAVREVTAAPVLALLAGASLVGAEACLYPPVEDDEAAELRDRFEHAVEVTGEWVPGGSGFETLAGARSTTGPGGRPHLVLTTGTTGAPRGVRHDWDRLLRGVRRVAPAPDQAWLLAYGLHQFAGLQVLLHVLAAGATLVAPAPRRSREGLAAMRDLGVTHASATPTYWRFLLAELRADQGPTPALRQVTLGGEAIPGPLLPELERTFPGARVSQVYAASEFGSSGSMRDGRPGLSTDVLDRPDDADVAMRVVDGELWVRSRTGMLGYYGEEPVGPDDWRPTGDLVEVVGDRILFRGRASEIINVGGVKVHPLPVEERVSAVPGVALARVYGRSNPMTGAIVALEVVAEPEYDGEELKERIREACADLPAAARPRSIRLVTELATAGSKIVRRDLREQ